MKYFYYIIFLMLLLSSCKKGEVPSSSPIEEEKSLEVCFNSGISVSVDEYSARAPIEGNTFPEDIKVGIFGIKAKSNNWDDYTIMSECQSKLQNAEYTSYENGRLFQKEIAEYPRKSSGYDGLVFYGYYPYLSDLMDYEDWDGYYLPIKLNKDDMSKTVDYLYTGRVNKVTPASETIVPLPFKHALGRIKFIFNKTSTDVNVGGIIVSAYCSTSGKMYIENGLCITDDTSSRISYKYRLNKNLNTPDEVTADFMMFPKVEIVKIQCDINGKFYTVYDTSSPTKINLESGKVVLFRINFSPQEANLSSSIEGWEEQGSQDVDIDESTGDVVVKREP